MAGGQQDSSCEPPPPLPTSLKDGATRTVCHAALRWRLDLYA
jgi:hypothetical protein